MIELYRIFTAAANNHTPGNGYVIQGSTTLTETICQNEVTLHGHILQGYPITAYDQIAIYILIDGCCIGNIACYHFGHNRSKFCTGNGRLWRKLSVKTTDIPFCNHRRYCLTRPFRHLCGIAVGGQTLRIGGAHFKSTRQNHKGFFTGNLLARIHFPCSGTNEGPHFYCFCHIPVIPRIRCHIRVAT